MSDKEELDKLVFRLATDLPVGPDDYNRYRELIKKFPGYKYEGKK